MGILLLTILECVTQHHIHLYLYYRQDVVRAQLEKFFIFLFVFEVYGTQLIY